MISSQKVSVENQIKSIFQKLLCKNPGFTAEFKNAITTFLFHILFLGGNHNATKQILFSNTY